MSAVFEGLKPPALWKHFAEILKIPHCSGNEKALGDYILSVASALNLDGRRDRAGNIIVSKPPSAGREKAEGVVLQGHMDMVCEKNADVAHDFSRDPIVPEIKDGWLQAKGTTLGADNGIGVAAALAVMEDGTLEHGPLEFLFTVDEETGLTGANKLARNLLRSKMMFNLDSEEMGTFTIGCSGGADSEVRLPLDRKRRRFRALHRLKLTGLRGGHSGLDIHLGLGNAIRLLARMLEHAQEDLRFELVRLEGGNKRNAIPREAWADFYADERQVKKIRSVFKTLFGQVQKEYLSVEKDASFSLDRQDGDAGDPLTQESQSTLLRLTLALPHGVIRMHPEIPGLVETSSNLAIVRCGTKEAEIICSSRSSVAPALDAVRRTIRAVAALAGAKVVQPEGYPGWQPNLDSKLLKRLVALHKTIFGREPAVKAVHAGLECGIIGQKYPGMEMISFGPTIEHPHSPKERVHVGSVEEFWRFLTAALRDVA